MLKTFLLSLLMVLSIQTFAQNKDETIIRQLLAEQVISWNSGKIDGFMNGYWESDSLVFIGKNGPTYGYAQTLERYHNSYSDADAMGKLTSTVLSMKKISPEYYFITGKWEIERESGGINGYYTLLFQKKKGKWVIVCDHSS